MDRNTVIAILLTGALVFGYMNFFGPKKNQAQPANSYTNNIVQTQPNVASNAATDNLDAEHTIPASSVPTPSANSFETLSNGLATYTFSQVGGDIYSIVLEKTDVVLMGPYTSTFAPSNNWQVPFRLQKIGKVDPNDLIMAVSDKTELSLSYTGTLANTFLITKKYDLSPDTYVINTSVTIANITSETIGLEEGVSIWLGQIEPATAKKDRFSTPEVDVSVAGEKEGGHKLERMKASKKDDVEIIAGPVEWLDVRNKYYANIMIPRQNAFSAESWSVGPKSDRQTTAIVTFMNQPLAAGTSMSLDAALYAGPKEYETLNTLSKAIGHGDDYVQVMDLGIFSFLAKPILVYGLKGLYKYFHNYGIAIIIVTIIIKLLTWPLTTKSVTSMKKMGQLQPEMKAIREKYKAEPQKVNQEMMLLYRKHGYNPLSGCLPMLLQLPVFLALYAALSRAIELHGATFLWIKDLSMPDSIYTLPYYIPFFGDKAAGVTGLHPLAIAMGVAMLIQQMLTPKTGDASQQRMMMIMPAVFIVIFYNMPSGLVLYWFVNQLLSIGQMYYLHYIKK